MLGLILGVQVVEVAEELVEAVNGRQEFVAIAEMVLAELSGGVALRLEQLGNGRVLLRQPLFRRRQSDFQESCAQRTLSGDERGAAGGAGLLAVIVGEDRALVGDAVDVGRAITHLAAVVGADVPVADVVAHDDEDVRLLLLRRRRRNKQRLDREAQPDRECAKHSSRYLEHHHVAPPSIMSPERSDRRAYTGTARRAERQIAWSGLVAVRGRPIVGRPLSSHHARVSG